MIQIIAARALFAIVAGSSEIPKVNGPAIVEIGGSFQERGPFGNVADRVQGQSARVVFSWIPYQGRDSTQDCACGCE
jgi:hypothetical protein